MKLKFVDNTRSTRKRLSRALASGLLLGTVLSMGYNVSTTDASVNLSDEAKQLTEDWTQAKYSAIENAFDAQMQSALPQSELLAIWNQWLAKDGAFQGIGQAQTQTLNNTSVVLITLNFQKGAVGLEWTFSSSGSVTGLHVVTPPSSATWQRPSYDKASSFRSISLTVGKGFLKVPAELDVPNGKGPFPAVVFMPGSGPEDMNEQVSGGPEEPFRDLAVGLASNGIAVLRYDKPTFTNPKAFEGASHMNRITPAYSDVADAEAALRTLLKQPKIDPSEVFLLGHSLGGYIAPMVAQNVPKVAGLILMGAPTQSLADVLVPQERYLDQLKGPLTSTEKQQLAALQTQVNLANSAKLTVNTPANSLPEGLPAQYWLFYQHYNALKTAQSLRAPMLIMQGGRDYQVTPNNLTQWKNALKNHSNIHYRLFPALNHLFVSGTGKSTPNEYMLPGHVASNVIAGISGWLHAVATDSR